jgi:hypothetical protein
MKFRIACLALAALAASACEHPFANAGIRSAPPGAAGAPATEGERAVLASATLQALLRQHAAAPVSGRGSLPAGSTQPRPLADASWLEAQSAALHALAERSRAARLAADAASEQP